MVFILTAYKTTNIENYPIKPFSLKTPLLYANRLHIYFGNKCRGTQSIEHNYRKVQNTKGD